MNRTLVITIAFAAVATALLAWAGSGPDAPRREPVLVRSPGASSAAVAAVRAPAPPPLAESRAAPEGSGDPPAPTTSAAAACAEPEPEVHQYLPDRVPDEVLPDGTHVYHDYPFRLRQPDGTFATIPVTVNFKPVPAVPAVPPEREAQAGR